MKNVEESIVDLILQSEISNMGDQGKHITSAHINLIKSENEDIKRMLEGIAEGQRRMIGNVEMFTDTQRLIEAYRKSLEKTTTWDTENDIRINILNQLLIVMIPYIANLSFSINTLQNHQYQINGLKTKDFKESKKIIEIYHTSNQSMLLYSLTAILERFIRLIAKVFEPSNNITGKFYPLRKKVFKALDISDERDENQAIRLLTSMRNCIHNNGIHVESDREIIYHRKSLLFKKDRPHDFATFQNFNLILLDILNLVKVVNSNPLISNRVSILDECMVIPGNPG